MWLEFILFRWWMVCGTRAYHGLRHGSVAAREGGARGKDRGRRVWAVSRATAPWHGFILGGKLGRRGRIRVLGSGADQSPHRVLEGGAGPCTSLVQKNSPFTSTCAKIRTRCLAIPAPSPLLSVVLVPHTSQEVGSGQLRVKVMGQFSVWPSQSVQRRVPISRATQITNCLRLENNDLVW